MNAIRIVADEPTRLPTAALAIYRQARPVCVCFGTGAQTDSETLHRALASFRPLVEALNIVKAKFYAEGTFDPAGRLLVPFACDDFAQICWALSLAEADYEE